MIADRSRPTSLKSRFIDDSSPESPRQLLRVDRECRDPIASPLETRLIDGVSKRLVDHDLVIVSDYDKGVCTPRFMESLVSLARSAGCRMLVDPAKSVDYGRYRGASCLTPNRLEAQSATGLPVRGPMEALAAGEMVRSELDAEAVVVTLDKDGMVLAHRDGRRVTFGTRTRNVRDVTGAGDMVISVLGLSLGSGMGYEDAIPLCNLAAGMAVERMGAVALTPEELVRGAPEVAPRRC